VCDYAYNHTTVQPQNYCTVTFDERRSVLGLRAGHPVTLMAAILRQALPQLRRAAAVPKGVRQMSGHSIEEEIKEMNKWRTISYAAVPGVILLTVYTLATATHHHSDEKIVRKAFCSAGCERFR